MFIFVSDQETDEKKWKNENKPPDIFNLYHSFQDNLLSVFWEILSKKGGGYINRIKIKKKPTIALRYSVEDGRP